MEEQKNENNEALQQEKHPEAEERQGNSSTRSSILWIFAGGYLVYTGYRLCEGILKGTDDASKGFLVAGGIFIVIGAVLLIKAVRNLAKEGAEKAAVQEEMAKKVIEENSKKKMSISERAHLAENLDDVQEDSEEETVENNSAE
ncbi:hypothetical protein WMO28_11445 [Blautia sp. CLA-JM-H16]|jgi:Na+/melibiose symporter-like transporter|uniref:DUF308 domain-containing protein n=1 Tax=Blautia aquisgranensis TaxID=3133153 RepID=A0ABV1BFX9_9FIRM